MWPFKYKNFYQSTDWIEIRNWAIKKYGRVCMKCGSTDEIHVDHRLPRSVHPELALNKYNVGILCGPCNRKKAARIEKDYRPLGVQVYCYLYPYILLLFRISIVGGIIALVYFSNIQ